LRIQYIVFIKLFYNCPAGHIVVRNLSAYWIPEIKVKREIHGTVYTITGSFEGNEFLDKKLTRILLKNVEDAK